ncbi:hypothetical protein ACFYS8_16785 [Kitasatospora sp. NPDC004615]|uniref:hypothetical protein n=1 Tax=Kitasatospora sp. NPDC004615 TaxID=3364017 RepID=UPI0036752CA0
MRRCRHPVGKPSRSIKPLAPEAFQHDPLPGRDERNSHLALVAPWHSPLHHDTGCAAGALAVPFLIRIAVGHPFHRAAFLALVAGLARRQHLGDGSRTGLLRAARADDQPIFEPSGYLANWSVQAAREALAADAELLVPLLGDPDPEVRQHAAYALTAALGRSEPVMPPLHRPPGLNSPSGRTPDAGGRGGDRDPAAGAAIEIRRQERPRTRTTDVRPRASPGAAPPTGY